jgi:hypothetical protein
LPGAGELAWIGAIPCAAVVLGLVLALGPLLGDLLFPRDVVRFIAEVAEARPPRPEPTEQARFLLSLTAPLLLAAFVVIGRRRLPPLPGALISRLVMGTQALALAFLATCLLVQRWYRFELVTVTDNGHTVYFTAATLVASAAIALALGASIASARVTRAFTRATRESRARLLAGTALATAATLLWLLPAVNFDDTIGNANELIARHLPYWLDEAFAVLDGRRPLVDFAAQYGSLWPYLIGEAMALSGGTIGVFTIATAAVSAAAMLALFATFRRIARSTMTGLLLFVPFLATSFFMMRGPFDDRYSVANLFSTFPLRYAAPFLVVWIVARHLDGAFPRRARWLFLAAGLAILNNGDFGVPALGASLAAVIWSWERPTLGRARRLVLEAAIGLAGALVLVSLLTLATAGSLPHLELLFRFSRLFVLGGWGMLPMRPVIGVSTIIYLTYVAAIGAATVRAVNAEPDRLMTGLLAWSGVFGLGIGSYYMGRSHPEVLTNMLAAWALSVTLLFVLAVRTVAARPSRRPTLAEAMCLFGFGVLACSSAQAPRPWSEVARLQRTGMPIYAHPEGERFIRARTRRGETTAVFAVLGHRVGYNLGIMDVVPSSWGGDLASFEQVDEALDRLAADGGTKVFLSSDQAYPELLALLASRGYQDAGSEAGMTEYALRR